ncbi:MAG TPA: glutamate 5-kinase [Ghiorsea sp.]|nr:glutamate 5-kinase [Ghiorsea sp.]HIP07872.1 glutamate 5-kinase [Mariprofundaceae bacterium]
MMKQRDSLKHVKRIVLKVGSSLLADAKHGINTSMVQRLAADIKALHEKDIQVCLVSSGAVALGRVQLGWLDKKLNVHEKQAAAAIGQPLLMHAYQKAFSELGLVVAQMLLTKDDLRHRRRYINASNTSKTLFSAQVIPIVNENDTVVVEEIKFGDNDSLGALVSTVVEADLMVMMTDVDGLFETNPYEDAAAKRVSVVNTLTSDVMNMAGDVGSNFGTGGMKSKLDAAKISTQSGVMTAIIHGEKEGELTKLLAGEDVGTLFTCGSDRHSWHEHWITNLLSVSGKLVLKEGVPNTDSVMLEHMQSFEGQFDKGECVEIWHEGVLMARGLTNYNSEDMYKLLGRHTKDIEAVLGYVDFKSMVHQDNLVMVNKR